MYRNLSKIYNKCTDIKYVFWIFRQNVLSRNDALSPPQNRENLTALFDVLSKVSIFIFAFSFQHDQFQNNISHVEVSSSCADVTLTTQPSFLNTPIAICDMNDKCVKMDFYYSGKVYSMSITNSKHLKFSGEKVVLRNCLSNLMETVNSPKLKKYCPMYSDDRSEM